MIIKSKIPAYLLFLFLLLSSSKAFSQNNIYQKPPVKKPVTRILFLFDASRSMYGTWQSDTKIEIAKKLLGNLLDSLKKVENLQLALRCYGHTKDFPPQDCDDTRLEVPFNFNNADKIKHTLKYINPRGTTPIAISLEKAAGDFPPCEDCRNIIILITDGIEECKGDPCAVSLALQKKGIILKPFVIGIGKNFEDQFNCVGTYFDASTEEKFRTVLNIVISQAVNSTTCQINLLDVNGKPTETNVNMTFYDLVSGLPKYNFIHTMNDRGVPDTLVLDPLMSYRVQVHTIPPVFIDTLKLIPGTHVIKAVDAPQGDLVVKISNRPAQNLTPVPVIVRQSGQWPTLNIQNVNQKEKYIVGKYNLEVLTLPRTYIKNVKIDQSTTTTVELPGSGTVAILLPASGYGSLYVRKEKELEWFYNLKGTGEQETLMLQPGEYKIVFRSKYMARSMYTVERNFTVKSGEYNKVNLTIY